MSLIRLGFWAASGAGGVSYWLATLGGASNDWGRAIQSESSNFYLAGQTASTGAGGDDLLLVKYDLEGAVIWQRVLGGSDREQAYSLAVDSGGNLYPFGQTISAGAGGEDFLLAKYNSSGTIQWQRSLGGSSDEIPGAISVDSSDNLYVVGGSASTGAGGYDSVVAKYNSAGNLQFQRSLGSSSTELATGVRVDSSGNIYISGFTESTGQGSADALLYKYNSAGTIQWQRILGGTGDDKPASLVVDSAGNSYFTGVTRSEGAGGKDLSVVKYNSGGTIQWQRVLGGTGSDEGRFVALDSSDNIYVTGSTSSTGAGGSDFLLAKYNSSGTIQWQRVLGGTGTDVAYGLDVKGNSLLVTGRQDSTGEGSIDVLIASLPLDGSLTGTYVLDSVNMVYAASSLTAATSTLTAATSSLTDSSSSLTSSTSSLTDASSSLTSHFVEIPA